MASSATQPDLGAFLTALDFNRDSLASLKGATHTSSELRQAVEAEARNQNGDKGLRAATVLYLLSRSEEAIDVLGEVEGPQGSLLRGVLSLETGDPATAATAFGSLVGTDLEAPSLLVDLATAAALTGDTAMAKKAAQKLPEGAESSYAEGIAFESDGDYDDAMRKYEEALASDATHARSLFRLASRLDLQGEDARAIQLYQRLAALQPTYVNGLLNLALLYEDHGRYQEADQVYRRILKADPNHPRARVGLKDVQASQSMYYDEDHERREDRRNQILRTPITEFELSVRSRNCLSKMNIESLGDLVKKSEAELLAYKNFGETSLQEIKDILAQKGLRLGMSREDDSPLITRHAAASTDDDAVNALFGAPSAPPVATGAGGMDFSNYPIEKLELSIRARRCMDNLNIRMVGDLLQHTESALLSSKNFGQTSLNEIRRKLDSLGLALKRK